MSSFEVALITRMFDAPMDGINVDLEVSLLRGLVLALVADEDFTSVDCLLVAL